MPNSKITAIPKFRKMWSDGVSSKEIGRHFGCLHPAVNRLAKSLELPPRKRGNLKTALEPMVEPTRAADEVILMWVYWRSLKISAPRIARSEGTYLQVVSDATNAVRDADMRYGDEGRQTVKRSYW
jgi:hypothetical protein